MPTFDFQCRQCGDTFEATLPFGGKEFPPCPVCGGADIEKKLSPPAGIVFKGSGFYKTDSRKERPASAKATAGKQEGQPFDGAQGKEGQEGMKKGEGKRGENSEKRAGEKPAGTSNKS